jgi:anti-sigma-K factor RskA
MTPEEAEASFSSAYDGLLETDEQRAFDAALAEDPALAEQYAAFCRTLSTLKQAQANTAPTPDLLLGVQRRLRDKSGGRFYADRFAERAGGGTGRLVIILLALALVLAVIWTATAVLDGVHVKSSELNR